MAKKYFALVVLGIILAVWLSLGIIRFAVGTAPEETHYHANFAVYINGQRLPFDAISFYEEVNSGCRLDGDSRPEDRGHMHDQVNSVVHVHDKLVTWADFFTNIDFSVSDLHFKTWDKVFTESDNNKIRFILNDEEVKEIANRIIGNEDRLLVDVDNDELTELQARYQAIETTAGEFNTKKDPASCSGSQQTSLGERFKQAFLFTE